MLGITAFHPDLTLLIAAALAIPVGIVLWLNSVREAPILITFFLSAAGFFLPWLLPFHHLNFLTHASIGLGGVVLGIILGTICFRLSQAVLLACLVGGILGGGMMYHDGAFAKRSAPVRSPHEVATRPAAHLHKRPDTLKAAVGRKHPDTTRHSASASHPTIPQTVRRVLGHVYLQTRLAFGRLSHAQTSAVWALVVASALLTLLLALIYPQLASLAGGVWAGSLLMMAGAVVGLEYWHPEWVSRAFATVWPQATFLLLLVLGTAAQSRHLFKLRAAKKNAKADGGKKAKSTGEKK